MEEEAFGEKDWPIDGPRAAAWFLDSVVNSGSTPVARHSKWVSESGIGAESRSAHEHHFLSHTLEKMVTVDQLCAKNLVAAELLVRRLVLLEEAHSTNPVHPSFEGAEHWLGLGERKAGVLVPPALAKHVATRVAEETAVSKERRKAREERRLARTPGKGDEKGAGKGDGKGT